MKRLETGAFVKDYEGSDKEVEQAVQMVISQVASEDPRFLEKEPPLLSEEFPDGCKIFFLGEHAYGVAAQVASTHNDSLSVVLAVRDNASLSIPFELTAEDSSFLLTKRRTTTSKQLSRIGFLSIITPPSKLPTYYAFLDERCLRLRLVLWF